MTVRAFRGTDGLYIAYEVNHIVSITPSKWDEGWWKNTNIEFYVNGSGTTSLVYNFTSSTRISTTLFIPSTVICS